MLYDYIASILNCDIDIFKGEIIGYSLEKRSIQAYTFGTGDIALSLIAGNHADEPIGPLLLKKLVTFLNNLDASHELLKNFSWHIIPHGNPDGEAVNKAWYTYKDKQTHLANYLLYAQRELPGADIEFGYPNPKENIPPLRPENEAAYNFWKSAKKPFKLHVSLHGMKATYGPWFLIDENWIHQTAFLRSACKQKTHELGYELYDLNRFGEKGFKRIAEGFCTRPDSRNMKKHFLALNDLETANKFHPSSMEAIRQFNDDCLTLVSEMPLFLYPKKERELTWPDNYIQNWSTQFTLWKQQLHQQKIDKTACNLLAKEAGVIPMPWEDQLKLQWQLIVAGIETVTR